VFYQYRFVPAQCCEVLVFGLRLLESRNLHIGTLYSLVDSQTLHIRHSLVSHPFRDSRDDIGMNQVVVNKLLELLDLLELLLSCAAIVVISLPLSQRLIPQSRRYVQPSCF
jgi:hypothetical protein